VAHGKQGIYFAWPKAGFGFKFFATHTEETLKHSKSESSEYWRAKLVPHLFN